MSAAEDFAQYKLHFIDAIQHDYEVIRPIVLFAETIAERSRQTGLERNTIGDKARRFVQEGMLGLVDQRAGQAGRKGHRYPEAVAAYLRAHGLRVLRAYPDRLLLDVAGTARQVEEAFGVLLLSYRDRRGHVFYANAAPPHLPVPLAGLVGTVVRRGKGDQFVAVLRFLGQGAMVELRDWQVEPAPP